METVLLHKSAFLYVTSIFRLSSFVFANALLTGITKTFVPFYSSFPEIFRNFKIWKHSGNPLNVIIGYYKFNNLIAMFLIVYECVSLYLFKEVI